MILPLFAPEQRAELRVSAARSRRKVLAQGHRIYGEGWLQAGFMAPELHLCDPGSLQSEADQQDLSVTKTSVPCLQLSWM